MINFLWNMIFILECHKKENSGKGRKNESKRETLLFLKELKIYWGKWAGCVRRSYPGPALPLRLVLPPPSTVTSRDNCVPDRFVPDWGRGCATLVPTAPGGALTHGCLSVHIFGLMNEWFRSHLPNQANGTSRAGLTSDGSVFEFPWTSIGHI